MPERETSVVREGQRYPRPDYDAARERFPGVATGTLNRAGIWLMSRVDADLARQALAAVTRDAP